MAIPSESIPNRKSDRYLTLGCRQKNEKTTKKSKKLFHIDITLLKKDIEKNRESQAEQDETPQQLIVRLASYLDNWVELSSCKDLRELILQEKFITSCPSDLSTYLRERKIGKLESLAENGDNYLTVHLLQTLIHRENNS